MAKSLLMNFLLSYGWLIILAIAFFFWRLKKNKDAGLKSQDAIKTSLRETAYMAFLGAEKALRRGEIEKGERFKKALSIFYDKLPETARAYFTKESMEKFLQKQYINVKDFLDDGIINSSDLPPRFVDKIPVYDGEPDTKEEAAPTIATDDKPPESTMTEPSTNVVPELNIESVPENAKE